MIQHLLHRISSISLEIVDKSKWGLLTLPFIAFIEKYIFNQWAFLIWLSVLVVMDTGLGFYYAIKNRCISQDKLSGIIAKILIYGSVLVLGHVVGNVEVNGLKIPGGIWFTFVAYMSLIGVEGNSIVRNAGKINPRLVPKSVRQRFEGFDENGDFRELTKRHGNEMD